MNKKLVKKILFTLILLFACFKAIGLKNANLVNHITFVSAIGIDKIQDNDEKILVTFQIVPPQVSLENGSDSAEVLITSVEADSIEQAITYMHNYISSVVNFSQTRAIIFSEEIARDGLQKYLSSISSSSTLDTNMYVIVAENESAKDFLEAINKNAEMNPFNYFNVIKNSEFIGSSSQLVTVMDFLKLLNDPLQSATVTLGRLENITENENGSQGTDPTQNQGQTNEANSSDTHTKEANDEPQTNVLIDGVAIFKDDKMIGTLTGQETAFHLMINKTVNVFFYQLIQEKEGEKIATSLYCWQNQKSKIQFDQSNFIDITIPLNVSVVQTKENTFDFYNEEYMQTLRNDLIEALTLDFDTYFKKLQTEYKTDIDGLMKKIKYRFLTQKDIDNYEMNNHFCSANIRVHFDIKFVTSGLSNKK